MPSYEYTCGDCGPFTVHRAMQDVTPTVACPVCECPARRVYTAPHMRRTAPGVRRALDAQEASRHEPRVVDSIPPSTGRRNVTTNPLHRRLPRP
jgi:putative FmdB family regulatory protein